MGYGNLIIDNGGLPIPQCVDNDTQNFEPLYSKNRGLLVKNVDAPDDGVFLFKLISKDGKQVAISESGVPVTINNSAFNTQQFTGETWVPAGISKNMNIIKEGSYSGAGYNSVDIWNGGAKNGFMFIEIKEGTSKINKIKFQIKMNNTYIDYKEISVDLGVGSHLITFGVDDEKNKFIIPAEFRIRLEHDGANSIKYGTSLQLI